MPRAVAWGAFAVALALFIVGRFSILFSSLGGAGFAHSLRAFFPASHGTAPWAFAGTLVPLLFGLSATWLLAGLQNSVIGLGALWRPPAGALKLWPPITAAYVMASGVVSTFAIVLQWLAYRGSFLGHRGGIFALAPFIEIAAAVAAAMAGWRLLFGGVGTAGWRWLGLAAAALAVTQLAWLIWPAAVVTVFGLPPNGIIRMPSFISPTTVLAEIAAVWAGLALARAVPIGRTSAPSRMVGGYVLLSGALLAMCIESIGTALMAWVAGFTRGWELLAIPFALAMGYAASMQVISALHAAGIPAPDAEERRARARLTWPMKAILVLAALSPAILVGGFLLLLGLAFRGPWN